MQEVDICPEPPRPHAEWTAGDVVEEGFGVLRDSNARKRERLAKGELQTATVSPAKAPPHSPGGRGWKSPGAKTALRSAWLRRAAVAKAAVNIKAIAKEKAGLGRDVSEDKWRLWAQVPVEEVGEVLGMVSGLCKLAPKTGVDLGAV